MRSTVNKYETLREAIAQAVVNLSLHLIETLKTKSSPKGDALEIARAAGIMAAKRTWELIPYCHPIPIDQIVVEYTFDTTSVTVTARVTAVAKTGVEMEALVAAQFAATTLFDMLKPMGEEMSITDVKVIEKRGGKSSFTVEALEHFTAAVIVTSDGVANGKRQDRSGRLIEERLHTLGISSCEYVVVPDEQETIRKTLLSFHERGVQLVITTGGTGVGPRDVTVEATQSVIERQVPGIMEAARNFGQRRTPFAMLSRGIAGVKGKMLIVNLPGSLAGTQESLDAIFPAVLHVAQIISGGGH